MRSMRAAMRADRTIRPQNRLQLGEGRFFVMKMLCVQDGHGLSHFLVVDKLLDRRGFVKYVMPRAVKNK